MRAVYYMFTIDCPNKDFYDILLKLSGLSIIRIMKTVSKAVKKRILSRKQSLYNLFITKFAAVILLLKCIIKN